MPLSGTFTTVTPDIEVSGRFQLADGQTVGVAAPIILQFDAAIAEDDRAEVSPVLKVMIGPEEARAFTELYREIAAGQNDDDADVTTQEDDR